MAKGSPRCAGRRWAEPLTAPAAAFAACLEQLGVAAADAVYVGDDWRIDIRGARDVGLHPVWLKHHRVMRTYPEVDTDIPVITSLTDLIPLLDVL